MSPLSVKPCSQAELAPVRHWLRAHEDYVRINQPPGLRTLQADGCLLLAHQTVSGKASLRGLAGLDPGQSRIALLAARDPACVPALLDAAERLAVSFGLQSISLAAAAPGRKPIRLPPAWRAAQESGPLLRNLSRRQTALARRVRQLHAVLGVPEDYGRAHRLRLQAEPRQLASIGLDVFEREQFMLPAAAAALRDMLDQAAAAGIEIQPVSAFRSVDYQHRLLRNKLDKGQAMADILRVSAAPGFSEHHSGRAVDLTTPGCKPLEEEFADSPAFAWLVRHAGDFGFRLSYPAGNRHGVAYEPWHWYWLGR